MLIQDLANEERVAVIVSSPLFSFWECSPDWVNFLRQKGIGLRLSFINSIILYLFLQYPLSFPEI